MIDAGSISSSTVGALGFAIAGKEIRATPGVQLSSKRRRYPIEMIGLFMRLPCMQTQAQRHARHAVLGGARQAGRPANAAAVAKVPGHECPLCDEISIEIDHLSAAARGGLALEFDA
ncbi:MAG: hypothetical protein JO081_10930 [Alphaproteobacteria bacterium]|nr:hypothetical protein [Alphaproteobacteria bacterium]